MRAFWSHLSELHSHAVWITHTMLYASCKKILIFCRSNSLLSTGCDLLSCKHTLKSGVMSAIVRCALLVALDHHAL